MQTVDEATKALWDYINSLEPEQRAKAVAFQHSLEAEAAATPGGMMAVLPKRLKHVSYQLIDALSELQEVVAEVVTERELKRILKP